MSTPFNIQLLCSIFAGVLIAGAWWYIALRLPFHWITYALAMMATVGVFISLVIVALLQARHLLSMVAPLSYLRTGLSLLDGVLYIAFAAWITSGTKANT